MSRHIIDLKDIEEFETTSLMASSHGRNSSKDLIVIVKICNTSTEVVYAVKQKNKTIFTSSDMKNAVEKYNELD